MSPETTLKPLLGEIITTIEGASSRPSWEEYALQLAEVAAKRSIDFYRKVGACALDHENRVIGVSYNGLSHGKNVEPDFWVDRDQRRKFMIHAETNLLSLIKRGECKLLACTLLPCTACANAIAAHNIPKVVYRELYDKDQSALEIFKFHNIELKQI